MVFPDRRILAPLVGLSIAALTAPAMAAPCGGDFGAFVATFQREALAKGISQRTVSSAFVGVTPDPQVLAELDDLRSQLSELHERVDFTERLLAERREPEQLPPR